MNQDSIAQYLEQKGVKPTANRILVVRALKEASHPCSLTMLTSNLKTIDKSNVYRTLCMFLEKDVVHSIDDGSGSIKYELCPSPGHSMSDMHAHFYCTMCGNIFCLQTGIPPCQAELPKGFIAQSSNYVIKGVCNKCSSTYGNKGIKETD